MEGCSVKKCEQFNSEIRSIRDQLDEMGGKLTEHSTILERAHDVQQMQARATENLTHVQENLVNEIKNFRAVLESGFSLGKSVIKLFHFIATVFLLAIIILGVIAFGDLVEKKNLKISTKYLTIEENKHNGNPSDERTTQELVPSGTR